MKGNELTLVDDTPYCSIKLESFEQRKMLMNSLSAPHFQLSAMVGKTIALTDVYACKTSSVDDETGEYKAWTRIILFDDEGKSYACGSTGIWAALKNIFAIFGSPNDWEIPLPVMVNEIVKSAKRKILTLTVV